MDRKVKLVVVGDSFTGKTSLLHSYSEQKFVSNYVPTVYDNFTMRVGIEGRQYNVNLFDTAGSEEYAHLRSLSYPQSDVFLLCFSMVDRKTLDSCQTKWMPEIRKYMGSSTPVLLVGTKEDQWEKCTDDNRISLERAKKVADELGCISFHACSSLTLRGLKRVFDEAFLAGTGVVVTKEEHNHICCAIS